MQLRLDAVTKRVGTDTHLYTTDFELQSGEINVLLGAPLAGKTSLLRMIAGLDRPTSGRVLIDGRDSAEFPLRQRNLAMVYQQFINYPSLTAFENIASPLRLRRLTQTAVGKRVGEIAERLRLTPFLERRPAELSGGQQQRVALARAVAKEAELVLLDEPLVNLDYKLREELRGELKQLFRGERTTIVYATTEPQEALQLGGCTAIVDSGKVLQAGPTVATFLRPTSLAAAQVFSDPPLNVLPARQFDFRSSPASDAHVTQIAVRAHCLGLTRRSEADAALAGCVELTEFSGSNTFVHVACERHSLVAQLPGVHAFAIGAQCTVYMSPADLYGFGADGKLLFSPHFTAGH